MLSVVWLTWLALSTAQPMVEAPPPLVLREYPFEKAPFPECHASSIVETPQGLVITCFGGTKEKNKDVGIWVLRQVNNQWTKPIEVADGIQPDGTRQPCWNPVLFAVKPNVLHLYYKVGPDPNNWWGMRKTSNDHGLTWSAAEKLPVGILGPIKNKPIRLSDGAILSPSSVEDKQGWRIHFERSTDDGKTWARTPAVDASKDMSAIQPSILALGEKKLLAIGRTRNAGVIYSTESTDNGLTWSPLAKMNLPNPNSGTDAVTLNDGRHLLVYNHTKKGRSPLNVAVSADGKGWQAALELENQPGEYSYPAIIQASDGLVHILYTWKRQKLAHVVIDPKKLTSRDYQGNNWPGK